MRVIHKRCAFLDVHKREVVVAARLGRKEEVRSFGTTTGELVRMADWLEAEGCTHVGLESTGVYWKPIYNVLEGYDLTLVVVNAYEMKNLPGRKTDVADASWGADLLQHGLLKASFVPDRAQRELRELVRYRRRLIQERASEVARVQKLLEGANIKLDSVASDIMGTSCRAMLKAMIRGTQEPAVLAALAVGRLKGKREALEAALAGVVGPHQRFVLQEMLGHIEDLEARIERLSNEVTRRMLPHEAVLAALDTVTGVGRTGAQDIIAEIGVDMSRFPTHRHLASWAKVCPGNNRSAGKRKSGKTGSGNKWLRAALVEAARAAARSKSTYLSAQYHRLAGRRGAKRAALAVAHSILVAIYHILKDGVVYNELGGNFFDERDRTAVVRRLTRRIERLGYNVALTELQATAAA